MHNSNHNNNMQQFRSQQQGMQHSTQQQQNATVYNIHGLSQSPPHHLQMQHNIISPHSSTSMNAGILLPPHPPPHTDLRGWGSSIYYAGSAGSVEAEPGGSSGNPISINTSNGSGGTAAASAAGTAGASGSSPPSRYESQKRRDWNTFGQYLKNHRPPLHLSRCSGAHVLEFLRYLDQFGKTKVHVPACPFFGHPQPPGPCSCPLRQAWGSLDALIGRLRAAFEENGGKPESNPFGARAVRLYLREVREMQAKARGIAYEKKKRRRANNSAGSSGNNDSTAGSSTSSASASAITSNSSSSAVGSSNLQPSDQHHHHHTDQQQQQQHQFHHHHHQQENNTYHHHNPLL